MQKRTPFIVYFFVIVFSFYMFSCIPQTREREPKASIPDVKVLLRTVTNNDTIRFNEPYFLDTEEARYEFGKSNSEVFISTVKDGYKVYNDNRLFLFRKNDNVVFIPQDYSATFRLDNNNYQGQLKLTMNEDIHPANADQQ